MITTPIITHLNRQNHPHKQTKPHPQTHKTTPKRLCKPWGSKDTADGKEV